MKIADAANLLLAHTGKQLSSPPAASELAWVAQALNSAMETARDIAPWMFRKRMGIALRAPVSGSFSGASLGSTDIALDVELADITGCTILLDGKAVEIADVVSFGGGSTNITLMYPWSVSGVSSGAFQVFYDCVLLSGVERIYGPPLIRGEYGSWEMQIASTRDEYLNLSVPYCSLAAGWLEMREGVLANVNGTAGSDKQLQHRFHVRPYSHELVEFELDVITATEEILVGDFSGVKNIPFLSYLAHSVFVPFALFHFAASPWFAAKSSVRESIVEGYKLARARLEEFRPDENAGADVEAPSMRWR